MTAVLLAITAALSGIGLTEAVHALLHHRTEVAAVLVAAAVWVAHRVHRFFANPGTRVKPRTPTHVGPDAPVSNAINPAVGA